MIPMTEGKVRPSQLAKCYHYFHFNHLKKKDVIYFGMQVSIQESMFLICNPFISSGHFAGVCFITTVLSMLNFGHIFWLTLKKGN
jgi:hypothetical protein